MELIVKILLELRLTGGEEWVDYRCHHRDGEDLVDQAILISATVIF